MSDLNRVLLTGRLAADPELRYTQSGRAVVNFRIAVNSRRMNPDTQTWEEETTFVPIVAWGKQAENCAAYLQKGRLVAVDGRLRIRSFETQDGERRRIAEVVAQSVHFLGPKPQVAEFEVEPPADNISGTPPEEEVPF
ncbi:single-stranded DNA-binding protein [Candidatus Bipolaricaulota bacterium]|nr:single-stranded DNA-binding protein [Candidatus Bipolaricaulota bacterium]